MYNKAQKLLLIALSNYTPNVYRANAVPSGAEFPYLTYNAEFDEFGGITPLQITVYNKSDGYAEITEIVDKIIGDLPFIQEGESGFLNFEKGSPLVQDTPTEDPSIKAVYINIELMNNII